MTEWLLIPSAAELPAEMATEFGQLPSALVPVDNRPALAHIVDAHPDAHVVVVVAQAAYSSVEREAVRLRQQGRTVDVVSIAAGRSLGESVLALLRSCRFSDEDIAIVNFGDTLVSGAQVDDCAYMAVREDADNLTAGTFANGRLTEIREKGFDKSYLSHVFVGYFRFSDPVLLARCLEGAGIQRNEPVDPFYVALRQYAAQQAITVVAPATWLDLGHVDGYYDARRRLLQSRVFNEVALDERRGTVRKTSSNRDKLRAEIGWYRSLPTSLQHLSPRLFDYALGDDVWLDMEFYGYPTVADVYVHGQWGTHAWRGICRAIEQAVSDMRKHVDPSFEAPLRAAACRQMYVNKTLVRLDALSRTVLDRLSGSLTVNGEAVPDLPWVRTNLADVLHRTTLLEPEPFHVMHGDLCFSNILYDRRTSVVRLIDPRGSFGVNGLVGDGRYDLAKLAHSIVGDYDLIVANKYHLEKDLHGWTFSVDLTPAQAALKPYLETWLYSLVPPQQAENVDLLQALLFLSMGALHSDDVDRQTALLIRGLQLISSFAMED